jgi:hypothetical protein
MEKHETKIKNILLMLSNQYTVFDRSEIKTLKIMWERGEEISKQDRGRLWLKATGALNQMKLFQN